MTKTDRPDGEDSGHTGPELFEHANEEYDAGNYHRALELFDQAVKKGISNEVMYNNRGAALDAIGRGHEAVDSYLKSVSIAGRYELAWHNMANSLFSQEMYADAVGAYAKAAALNKERVENLSGLARAYLKVGKTGRAVAVIRKLDRFTDKDAAVLLMQCDLYIDAEELVLAEQCARKYLEKNPDDVEGFAHLGNVEHEMGVYGKAVDSYEKALQLTPDDKELWNNLGYTCFLAGFFDKAIGCFDKAILLDPLYKHAWYNKGYAYHGADMLERAVECYDHAVAIDHNDPVLWNNLGNALYNLGRYRDSIPKYVEALIVDPDYDIAWNNIGNALEKMDEYAEAIPYHDRSLEISPDFDYALFAKGVCKAETGDLEEGYNLVLESLDLNPSYDEAWGARAVLAERMGRLDEALLAVEESLAVNSEFDEGWTKRGEILLTMGNMEAAEASFQMALTCLESSHADTAGGLASVVRRGEVLIRLGRFEDALVNIETVVLAGRTNSRMILKDLELRRFMAKYELPKALVEIIRKIAEPGIIAECAEFMVDAGNVLEAERLLSVVRGIPTQSSKLTKAQARIMLAKGETDSALMLLNTSDGRSSDADLLVINAGAHEAGGDFSKAADLYSSALGMDPSNYAAAMGLARLMIRSKKADECISAADIAIGIDSREWEPHKLKAEAYELLNAPGMARFELAQAHSLLAGTGLRPEDIIGG
ncbi:MAG: hypothetical protein A3K60_08305 [Euryarchaeota archaeon RBG_19FT_COMBO_56_21]|nr:MAG: hypothetical protein A3K60_08305 [Euryarchaeota archaeon RBG_19FT_COMBO_56_21]